MRKLALIGIALLLTAVVASTACAMTKKAGDYTVDVTMDRNPPVTGKNSVEVRVKDKTGKAVTDAKVTVEYSMPPMSGMPAMNYKSDAELKGETYRAVISPSMAGSWNVAIKVARGGKTDTARLTIDVK
jgi:nitrogen fixation protein FixH